MNKYEYKYEYEYELLHITMCINILELKLTQ
jgi:hypothetical protein